MTLHGFQAELATTSEQLASVMDLSQNPLQIVFHIQGLTLDNFIFTLLDVSFCTSQHALCWMKTPLSCS